MKLVIEDEEDYLILKEWIEFFPEIKRYEYPANIITYEQKCQYHDKLLLEYLKKAVNGWSVSNFLSIEKIENFALYAITDFTEIVCEDLRHNDLWGSGKICDKKALKYPAEYKGWKIIDIDQLMELYHTNKINKVIVLSVLHENEIIDDLIFRGIALNDLISIVSILYS